MKKILALVVVLVLALSLAACGGGKDLIGTWKFEDNSELDAFGIDVTITFTEDKVEMRGASFDYEVKGNKIIIAFMGAEEEVEYRVEGNKLFFIEGDDEQVFLRVEE